MNLEPIGYLHCDRNYHEEQPRQGNLSASQGYIELVAGRNYEQGLKDLDGFSRIWVIYEFHQNKTWRPLTNPPRTDGKGKKGVFATRSPYRPNQIGISCVKLLSVLKNRIYIADSDLLNGTPILDIKPYIPEYDSFPDARTGWLENIIENVFELKYSETAQKKIAWLKKQGVDLEGVVEAQLGHDPLDKTRNKFIRTENDCLLRFKSWRIAFDIKERTVLIKDVISGYVVYSNPLGNDTLDDLRLHQKFNTVFN